MRIVKKILLAGLFLHSITSGIAFGQGVQEKNALDHIQPYVALLFPTAESGFFDLVIVHVLGLQNFHAHHLDKEVSYTKLLQATGSTLLRGMAVIPLINVLPEWETAFKKMINENAEVKREYLISLAAIASAISTALTFHMHYDTQCTGNTPKHLAFPQIIALSGLEGLTFHTAFSFGAAAIDKGLNTLHSTASKVVDEVMQFIPEEKTLLLDLVVCHALAHKNYDVVGLDKKPTYFNVAKAFSVTLLEGGILIPTALNGAIAVEKYFLQTVDQALSIKRDYINALVLLGTDIYLALAFHMHYENAFSSTQSMAQTYVKLASIIAKTSIEGSGIYIAFRVLGTGLDQSFDAINSYLGNE